MNTPKKIQPSFDDEISISDIIHFFKMHTKLIANFVVLGIILGGLYGKLAGSVYESLMQIATAKVAGNFVIDPKVALTKLEMNSYHPKETFLVCNPKFYKDKRY